MSKITLDQVIHALQNIKAPNHARDILSMGLVRDLKIDHHHVSFQLTGSPELEPQIREALNALDHAIEIEIVKPQPQSAPSAGPKPLSIPGVRHIIAVSSGKGGVGKSTVATNLAIALKRIGFSVGLLDADVYGPNIPTMMGVHDAPMAQQTEDGREVIIPLKAHGVRVMSMGFLLKGDQPAIWRGPMLHSVMNQFLMQVAWTEENQKLDYLVLDLPPGTGDVQLSLTQLVALTGAVIVTTPQEVALQDVRRAILMFERVGVPLIGIVENMSTFICDGCEKEHHIFGEEGGQILAKKYKTPLLAKLPLDPALRIASDEGNPVGLDAKQKNLTKVFDELARNVDELVRSKVKPASVTITGF